MLTYFNISLHGQFLFKTEKTCLQKSERSKLETILARKFPRSEGYIITGYETTPYWTSNELLG